MLSFDTQSTVKVIPETEKNEHREALQTYLKSLGYRSLEDWYLVPASSIVELGGSYNMLLCAILHHFSIDILDKIRFPREKNSSQVQRESSNGSTRIVSGTHMAILEVFENRNRFLEN